MSSRQTYVSSIEQAVKLCSVKEKCALVVDEKFFDEFLIQSKSLTEKSVNQIIVVSENLNMVYPLFKDKNMLLISVSDIEEALKFYVFGAELSNEVVFVSDKNETELQREVELLSELS